MARHTHTRAITYNMIPSSSLWKVDHVCGVPEAALSWRRQTAKMVANRPETYTLVNLRLNHALPPLVNMCSVVRPIGYFKVDSGGMCTYFSKDRQMPIQYVFMNYFERTPFRPLLHQRSPKLRAGTGLCTSVRFSRHIKTSVTWKPDLNALFVFVTVKNSTNVPSRGHNMRFTNYRLCGQNFRELQRGSFWGEPNSGSRPLPKYGPTYAGRLHALDTVARRVCNSRGCVLQFALFPILGGERDDDE